MHAWLTRSCVFSPAYNSAQRSTIRISESWKSGQLNWFQLESATICPHLRMKKIIARRFDKFGFGQFEPVKIHCQHRPGNVRHPV